MNNNIPDYLSADTPHPDKWSDDEWREAALEYLRCRCDDRARGMFVKRALASLTTSEALELLDAILFFNTERAVERIVDSLLRELRFFIRRDYEQAN